MTVNHDFTRQIETLEEALSVADKIDNADCSYVTAAVALSHWIKRIQSVRMKLERDPVTLYPVSKNDFFQQKLQERYEATFNRDSCQCCTLGGIKQVVIDANTMGFCCDCICHQS